MSTPDLDITGILQRLRERGSFPLTLPAAWVRDRVVYYFPISPTSEFRNVVRACRFDGGAGTTLGKPITAFSSTEMIMPVGLVGTTPVATHDEFIVVLGDFRGDVWMLDP